ncbi:caspase family protein [Streptomyces cyaneochromogenes]|uniref:caspase family protein n=1 Tax=Streptomyces cyaneochromogenes TaxID=2496836 RepID=UPI00158DDB88|nr:caspase family protein [Streptomyces cyaneochromogenes]
MRSLPDPAASRAVLVGVSRYSTLEPLPAVANNLPALADALTDPASWNLPASHCSVVAEPETQRDMLDPVKAAADHARDTLLVYFAGHGLVDGRGELFFGLPLSVQGHSYTGVTYQALREIVTDCAAQRIVIILDCCMSGRALGLMGGEDLLADQAEIDGSYLLAAAPENGRALAPPGETYTAFTGELLHILQHGITGQPRELDLNTVYQRLRSELAAKGRPTPQKRDRNTAGRLVLAHNRAYRPIPAPSRAAASETDWPDPDECHTPLAFLDALAETRVLTGLTIPALSERTDPPVAPATISRLLNRTTLPATWKTTGIYLAACGLHPEQIKAWQSAWQRLRTHEQQSPEPPLAPPQPPAQTWRARLPGRRRKRH